MHILITSIWFLLSLSLPRSAPHFCLLCGKITQNLHRDGWNLSLSIQIKFINYNHTLEMTFESDLYRRASSHRMLAKLHITLCLNTKKIKYSHWKRWAKQTHTQTHMHLHEMHILYVQSILINESMHSEMEKIKIRYDFEFSWIANESNVMIVILASAM